MSFYVYLAGALMGVGLLVGLNLLLMGRTAPRVSLEAAAALLASEIPGFRPARAVLARDGKAALVEDETETVFLVAAAGDKLVSRKLSPGSIRTLTCAGHTLTIRLHDFTFPQAGLVFEDETQARDWEARLAGAVG